MTVLLEVKNLVKNYGEIKAVNDVSFKLERGVCFGLLGPNGAGKTTTIEVIEDIIPPGSGEILYKGNERGASFKSEIGIQFQETELLSFMTVRETLATFKSLYSSTRDLEELIELCHLDEFKDQMNDKISGGQRQRFLLALALINQPEMLFLDEPSTGLDPQSRRNLWDIVQQVKSENKTIVLTTHYMDEAHYLCDEIAIMDYGKIIAQGTPGELIKAHSGGGAIILPKDSLRSLPDGNLLRYKEVKGKVEIKADDLNSCLETLISHNISLTDMTVRSPNLESVFLNLTGRGLRE